MSLDVKKAFTFPFKDPPWKKKLFIGGLFYLIISVLSFVMQVVNHPPGNLHAQYQPNGLLILLIGILSALIGAFGTGYTAQSVHNEIKNEPTLLPEWNSKFFTYFKYGISLLLINSVYIIVISIFIILLVIGFHSVSVIMLILSCLFLIPYMLIQPIIFTCYSENFKISDGFNLMKINDAIATNFTDYLTSIGLSILVYTAFIILTVVLTCTIIGAIIPSFLSLPVGLITMNLFAQTYKNAHSKGEFIEQTIQNPDQYY